MGPDNLRVHSFNKYLPSVCYILGLQPITESMVLKKTGTVPILREPAGLLQLYNHIHWLSLYIFHWHNNCNRLYLCNSYASHNSMQYYKPFSNINLFILISINNPLKLVKVLSKWYKWGNWGTGHTAKWQNWNLIPCPSLHGYLNLTPLTFWAW